MHMIYNRDTIKFIFSLCLIFGTIASVSFAQNTITGKVTAEDTGGPLPGVNIVVKGTSTGTSTDLNGEYSLDVGSSADSLVFSYIGYVTQTVAIGGQSTINLSLVPQTFTGEQLVVVGYGTQEKKSITSSVSNVEAEDFQKGQIDNPVGLIQGKVAGLSLVKPGSDPNGGYDIRLRGLSSLGTTQPLVVVDGIPGASLSSVDPNDIKSIDVLKDASASAIYGTRGSNGVIIITTKSGSISKGKPNFTIEYNGSVTASRPYRMQEVLSAQQFLDAGGNKISDQTTDWFGEMLQTGINSVNELAISGGADQTSYRASINYRDVQGIQRGTGFQNLNGRLNLTQYAINDNLTMNLNLTAQTRDSKLGFPQAFRYATIYNPTAPVKDPASSYGGYYEQNIFDYFNPVAMIEQNIHDGSGRLLSGSMKAEYDFSSIVSGLSLSAFYSQEQRTNHENHYYPHDALYNGINRHGLAQKYTENNDNSLFESTAHYLNTIAPDFDLELLGGYSWQEFVYRNQYLEGGNFLTDKFGYDNMSAAQDFSNGLGTVNSFKSSNKLIAFFGRANLNIKDTYFLMASIRREGSSRFGLNNKWGNFPAGSFGVEVTNMVDLPDFIDSFKPRVGVGVTGQQAPSSYLSLLLFGPTGGSFFVDGQWLPSFGPTQNPNPDLKWQTKREVNIGVDFTLLNSRIQGSVDYYTNTTKDLIYNATVSVPPNLSSNEWINVGTLSNKGLEANVSFDAIRSQDFSWNTSLNFSLPQRTKLKSLTNKKFSFGNEQILDNLGSPGQNGTPLVRVAEGEDLGQIWGPVFQSIDNGSWQFKDVNGDGTYDNKDNITIGNGLPTFEFGYNNNFRYKKWDLSVFFRGTFGHDLLNTSRAFYENPNVPQSQGFNVLASSLDSRLKGLTDAPKYSSLDVENASYVSLDNLTLGYNFGLGSNIPVRSLRLYVSGQNLWTITNYKGPDPSVRYTDGGNPLEIGIDRRDTWFTARKLTFGIDINF